MLTKYIVRDHSSVPAKMLIKLPTYISNLFNGGTPNNYADDTMNSHIIIKINGTVVNVTGTRNQDIGVTTSGLYLLDYNLTTNQYIINIILFIILQLVLKVQY